MRKGRGREENNTFDVNHLQIKIQNRGSSSSLDHTL